MQDSPAYRLNHEEVSKALEEGIVFAENLDPVEAVPDEFGHVQAMVFTRRRRRWRRASASSCPRERSWSPPARCPTSPTRRNIRGTFQLDGRQKFFQGFRAVKGADGRFTLEPDANGFFTSYDAGRPVRQLLRRQPPALQRQRRQGDGVGQAWLPARGRGCSRTRSPRSIPTAQPARESAVATMIGAARRRSCWRASSGSSG